MDVQKDFLGTIISATYNKNYNIISGFRQLYAEDVYNPNSKNPMEYYSDQNTYNAIFTNYTQSTDVLQRFYGHVCEIIDNYIINSIDCKKCMMYSMYWTITTTPFISASVTDSGTFFCP